MLLVQDIERIWVEVLLGGVIILDIPYHVVKDVKYKNGCSRDVDSW